MESLLDLVKQYIASEEARSKAEIALLIQKHNKQTKLLKNKIKSLEDKIYEFEQYAASLQIEKEVTLQDKVKELKKLYFAFFGTIILLNLAIILL